MKISLTDMLQIKSAMGLRDPYIAVDGETLMLQW